MSGDLTLYKPGSEVTVTLVAGTGGAYPVRGEGVELNGAEADHPQAEAVSGTGTFVGNLVDLPPDFDEDEDVSEGDVLGEATVLTRHYVDWMTSNDGALAPGDLVVYGADGVVAYSDATHTTDEVVGRVFKTGSSEAGTDGKVAVMKTN